MRPTGPEGSIRQPFDHRLCHEANALLSAAKAARVFLWVFTDDEALFRQLLLPWGVEPFLMPFSEDPEQTIRDAIEYLKRREWCEKGTWLVVITNALAREKVIDTIQLRQVE